MGAAQIPTVDDCKEACERFDEENAPAEWLLEQLFQKYPRNNDPTEVLLKTQVLNALYNTHIIAVRKVADHITSLASLDSLIAAGSPDAVDLITHVTISGKKYRFFSFASKYCSWHNPTAYPIYDGNVEGCLWYYRMRDEFTTFARDGYDYAEFVRIVTAFRKHYGLDSFTFKQLDALLYYRGAELKKLSVRRSQLDAGGQGSEEKWVGSGRGSKVTSI